MLMSRLADGLIVRQARAGRRFGRTGLSPQLQHFVEKQLGDCLILAHECKAHAEVGLSSIVFRPGHWRRPDGFILNSVGRRAFRN